MNKSMCMILNSTFLPMLINSIREKKGKGEGGKEGGQAEGRKIRRRQTTSKSSSCDVTGHTGGLLGLVQPLPLVAIPCPLLRTPSDRQCWLVAKYIRTKAKFWRFKSSRLFTSRVSLGTFSLFLCTCPICKMGIVMTTS